MRSCSNCRHAKPLTEGALIHPSMVVCRGAPPSRYTGASYSSGFPIVLKEWCCGMWASRSWYVRLALKLLP